MSMPTLTNAFLWYFVFLFSTVVHEASHAFIARELGDPTAYHGGQASLNPRPHIKREFIGMVVVPILSFIMGGWMFGWASTPYDPSWARRYPKRSAWMALAGPMANLGLVLLAGSLIKAGQLARVFQPPDQVTFSRITMAAGPGFFTIPATLLSIFFSLNLILFVFNLIPVPPLDGSGAVPLLLNDRRANAFQDFIRRPLFMIIGILLAWKFFGYIFAPILRLAITLLYPELYF